MTQRAVVHQVCGVCGLRLSSKAAMDEHIEEFHGVNWSPAMLRRAKDQGEFRPFLMQTRWGQEFKQMPRQMR